MKKTNDFAGRAPLGRILAGATHLQPARLDSFFSTALWLVRPASHHSPSMPALSGSIVHRLLPLSCRYFSLYRSSTGARPSASVRPGASGLGPASLHRHVPYFGLVLFFHDSNFRECSPTYSKTCRCSNLTNEKNERFRREGTSRPNPGGRDPPSARPTRLVFFDGSLARPAGFPPLSIDTSTLWKHRPPTSPTFLPLFLTLPRLDRCPTLGLRQAGSEPTCARQPPPSHTVLWTCTFFS
jgi:hypothetical protein